MASDVGCHPESWLGVRPALRALLALVIRAPLVFPAVLVPDALDAFVSVAKVLLTAIPIALAFDAFFVVADVVAGAVLVFVARPGHRDVGQTRQPEHAECTTGGNLEHATATRLRSQDARNGIKPICIHHLLLFFTEA